MGGQQSTISDYYTPITQQDLKAAEQYNENKDNYGTLNNPNKPATTTTTTTTPTTDQDGLRDSNRKTPQTAPDGSGTGRDRERGPNTPIELPTTTPTTDQDGLRERNRQTPQQAPDGSGTGRDRERGPNTPIELPTPVPYFNPNQPSTTPTTDQDGLRDSNRKTPQKAPDGSSGGGKDRDRGTNTPLELPTPVPYFNPNQPSTTPTVPTPVPYFNPNQPTPPATPSAPQAPAPPAIPQTQPNAPPTLPSVPMEPRLPLGPSTISPMEDLKTMQSLKDTVYQEPVSIEESPTNYQAPAITSPFLSIPMPEKYAPTPTSFGVQGVVRNMRATNTPSRFFPYAVQKDEVARYADSNRNSLGIPRLKRRK